MYATETQPYLRPLRYKMALHGLIAMYRPKSSKIGHLGNSIRSQQTSIPMLLLSWLIVLAKISPAKISSKIIIMMINATISIIILLC